MSSLLRYHNPRRSLRLHFFETDYYKARNEEMRAENEYNQLIDKRYESEELARLQDNLSSYLQLPFDAENVFVNSPLPKLPAVIESFLNYATTGISLPPLAAAYPIAASIAATTQGKCLIELTKGWYEPTSIYSFCAAESGYGKSGVLEKLQKPLKEIFGEMRADYNLNGITYKENRQAIKSGIYSQKKKIVRDMLAKRLYSNQAAIDSLSCQIKELDDTMRSMTSAFAEIPNPLQMLDNTTTYQLVSTLKRNNGIAFIFSDEGKCMLSRLKNESKKDLSAFLKGYDGETFTYQYGHKLITIVDPFLVMCLLIHIDEAVDFYKNPNLIMSGLCARTLLFIQFPSSHGCSNKYISEAEEHDAAQNYDKKIKSLWKMYSSPRIAPRSIVIKLEHDAYDCLMDYRKRIEEDYLPESCTAMRAFCSKAAGKVVRLAFTIHAMANEIPHESMITLSEMEAAIKLLEISMRHANFLLDERGYAAFQNAGTIVQSLLRISPDAENKIYRDGLNSRDMQIRTHLNKEQANNALAVLDRHNYIRIYDNGSPNLKFVLHPDFYDKWMNPLLRRENLLGITG